MWLLRPASSCFQGNLRTRQCIADIAPSPDFTVTDHKRGPELFYPVMTSLFDLSGKVALVTGGGKGLGKSMARAFAQAGADIFICSRSENELKAAAAEIGEGNSRRVEWMVADMTDPQQVQALGKEA